MEISPSELPMAGFGQWGVYAIWGNEGQYSVRWNEDAEMKIASVSKLLLLASCASHLASGRLDGDELLDRRDVEPVGGSGIWQHLSQDVLPLKDVATLVGSTSDNIATNVLLHKLGLDNVKQSAEEMGIRGLSLHDQVRSFREAHHPETLGTGTAIGLADFVQRVSQDQMGGEEVSRLVRGWLHTSFDLTQLAAAFHLDALSHPSTSPEVGFMNKTGSDVGVRADTGFLRTGGGSLTYAVVVNWDEGSWSTRAALDDMRAIGSVLSCHAHRVLPTDNERINH